jgi:Uma2 family endonuclease
VTIASTKLNARQFLVLGEDPPGVRLELVHGDIFVSPSPSYEHGYTDRKLSQILSNHIEAYDLGELVGDIDTIFGPDDVRRPDIIFTARARVPQLRGKGHGIHISPDLCIEILSPDSREYDLDDKFKLYAKHGVAHYWVVDPDAETFVAYKLKGRRFVKSASGKKSDVVHAEPFPDLAIQLARIWLPPLPA